MTPLRLEQVRDLLCRLQHSVRDALVAARDSPAADDFARVAAVTAADTIYQIDKVGEGAILSWFEAHWPPHRPVELVMEGVEGEEAVTFPRGTPVARTEFKCILDPIDGTRNLMYDKRSAWALAAVAPQRGPATHLGDVVVADLDGVVIVPRRAAQEVLRRCEKLVGTENRVRSAVRRGMTPLEAYQKFGSF